MTDADILTLFKETRALLDGHFLLTSGLHSGQYFQCAKVLQYPRFAEVLCGEIARHFRTIPIDNVIAPALGGIVVGQEVGRQLGVRTMFTERSSGSMQLRRGFEIHKGEKVLVCEDVITTGGSVQEVIDIVNHAGAMVVGVGAVVNRSGERTVFKNLYAAITMNVVTYRPEQCPLCQQGIPVEKPGSRSVPQPGR